MDKDGKLNVSTSGNVTIKNNYVPEQTTFDIQIHKNITCDSLPQQDNTFTFNISAVHGAPLPTEKTEVGVKVPAKVKDSITDEKFGSITFDHADDYTYIITEADVSDMDGFSCVENKHTVVVSVVDENGKLSVSGYKIDDVEGEAPFNGCTVTFTNNYDPADAELSLNLSMKVLGKTLPDDHNYTFDFSLTKPVSANASGGGNVTISGVTSASAKVFDNSFGELIFKSVGEYKYAVAETITDNGPVGGAANHGFSTNPSGATELVINVIDDNKGALLVDSVTFGGKSLDISDGAVTIEYTNEYSYTPVEFTFKVNKEILGNDLVKDHEYEFVFTLENVGETDGITMPTDTLMTLIKGTTDMLSDSFGAVKFTEPGTYKFKVSETEVRDNDKEVNTFEKSADYTVAVTVKDAGGKLVIDGYSDGRGGTYDETTNIATLGFTNTYNPVDAQFTVSVLKTISEDSDDLTADYDFEFMLAPAAGEIVTDYPVITSNTITAKVKKNAKISEKVAFSTMIFDAAGTYRFTVTETAAEEMFTIDVPKTFEVTVTDNGGKLEVTNVSDGALEKDTDNYTGTTLTFENEYDPEPATLTISVNNIIALQDPHAPLADGHQYEFSFELSENDERPKATLPTEVKKFTDPINKEFTGFGENYKTAEADRTLNIRFDSITFTTAGTYSFTVKEDDILTVEGEHDENHKEAFITYPTTDQINVKAEVKDINGKLTVTNLEIGTEKKILNDINAVAVLTFRNIYHADPSHFIFEIDKTVNGNLPEGHYRFDFDVRLTESYDGHHVEFYNEKQKVSIYGNEFKESDSAAGYVGVDFTKPGNYTFTVTETIYDGTAVDSSAFMSTDVTEHTVVVNVSDSIGKMRVESYRVDENDVVLNPEGYGSEKDYFIGKVPFENNYVPKPIALDLNIEKKMSDDSNALPKSYDFGFSITPAEADGAEVDAPNPTVRLNKDETLKTVKSHLNFTKAGTYSFTVSENSVTERGFKGHPDGQMVTVSVGDKGGELYIAEVHVGAVGETYTPGKLSEPENPIKEQNLTFINKYDPDDARLSLGLKKTVSGKGLPIDHSYTFDFSLTKPVSANASGGGNVTISGVTSASAKVFDDSFGTLTFDKAGSYAYTVTETITDNGPVGGAANHGFSTNPSGATELVINVIDDNKGALLVDSVTFGGKSLDISDGAVTIEYTNEYSYTPVEFTFKVNKEILGNDLVKDHEYEFDFTLENVGETDGITMPVDTLMTLTKGTTDMLSDSFGAVKFTEPGTYKFKVSETEVRDNDKAVNTFEKSADYTIAVTVKDAGGKLVIDGYSDGRGGTYDETSNIATLGFRNIYNPADAEFSLSVLKTVTGNDLPSGKSFNFTFNATAGGDNANKINIPNKQATINATTTQLNSGVETSFGTVTFSESGDYTVTVNESSNIPAGFKVNPTEYILNIHVKDNGGALVVTDCTLGDKDILDSGAATVEIENIYDPDDVDFTVKVNKTVDGSTVLDEDNAYNFKFTLSGIKNGGGTAPIAPAQTIENVTESTKGSISPLSFRLSFTEAGTYTFNLRETVTDKFGTIGNCGFTLPNIPAIKIIVSDKGTGSLEIESYSIGNGESVTGNEAVVNVENYYDPTKVEDFEVLVDKTVIGDELPKGYGEFEFALVPDEKNPAGADEDGRSVSVSYGDLIKGTDGKYLLKDGAKSISKIDFTAAGTYKFTVSENVSYGGFSTDNDSFVITVNVVDDSGVLEVDSCTVSPDDVAVISDNSVTVPFVNEFDAGTTTLNVSVNKLLTGVVLPDGHEYTFTFTLYEDGKPKLEKSVDATDITPDVKEEIYLGAIEYDAAGKHVYTVSETVAETVNGKSVEDVNGNNHGFGTTDIFTLNVSVEDKVSGNEQALEVSCTGATEYDAARNLATLDFVNTYSPETAEFILGVAKSVSGNVLPEGHEYNFTFALEGSYSDEKTVFGVTEKTKSEIPEVIFDLPAFTKAGEYIYTVSETVTENIGGSNVAGNTGFIAVEPINVTVKVVDDGGRLRVTDCIVDGMSSGETEKYLIEVTNRYVPDSVSVDDPTTPGGTDNNVVEISKILKTENGTLIDFPEAFSFNANVVEIDGAEKTSEPGTAGWGDNFADATILKTTGGSGGRGTVAVSGLRFTKAGIYKVTLTEDGAPYSNNYGSIRKDAHSAEIIYTVSDEGGKLVISDVDYAETEFVNMFIPHAKTVEMTFDKRLINTMTGGDRLALTEEINDELYNKFKTLYDGRFSFTMSHEEFNLSDIETDVADSGAELLADGRISAVNKMNKVRLGNVIIKREGSYTFTVNENQPSEGNRAERVGYGHRAVTVTFNVTADPKTGELMISEDYMYGEEKTAAKPAFINTYGPIPCTLTVTTEIATDPVGLEFDRTKAFEYEIRVWGDHIVPDAERNSDGKRTATFRVFYEKPLVGLTALDNEEEDTSVPVQFVETAEGSGVYAFTVAGYGDISFTVEGIPYGRVYYSVKQKLGYEDNALGYTFVSVDETYTYKETAEAVSRTEDRTDSERDDLQLETGEFFGEFDGTVITYHNLYTVTAKSEIIPEIEKKMSGERGLMDGEEYSFNVSLDAADGGAALSDGERTVKVVGETDPATGEVTAKANIGEITFTKPGVYTVTVKEIMPEGGELNGVKYDGTVYTVVYSVSDTDPATGVKDGKLRVDSEIYADGENTDSIVFTNSYAAVDTDDVSFDIIKHVIPDDPNALPRDEEYRFRITDENGLGKDTETAVTVYAENYDVAEGTVSGRTTVNLGTFGDIGSYSFTVSEIPSNTLGMVYDPTDHIVTVEVKDGLKGRLYHEIYVDGVLSSEAEFNNRYMTGSVTVTNTLTGVGTDVTLPFEYKVTVTGSDDLPESYNYTLGTSGAIFPYAFGRTINPSKSSYVIENGGVIALKHGEKFTVTGIPEGATVIIEQQPQEEYETTVNGEERFDFLGMANSSAELKAEYLNRHSKELGRFDDFVFKSQRYPGDGESVSVGDTLSYAINWRNPKLSGATVVIKDTLSQGVDFVSASGEYDYDPDTRTVVWTVNARGLEAGTVELTVKVNESAFKSDSVSNVAHAEIYNTSEPGGDPSEPTAEDDSDVIENPIVEVSVKKSESLDGVEFADTLNVRAGDTVTYRLTVTVSRAGAKNLTIVDVIPDGLEYSGSDDENAVYDPETRTVTWTFTDADGEPTVTEPGDVTVSYRVKVPEVSEAFGWSSCGYVYEGIDAAPNVLSDEYPWTVSNYVDALPVSDLTVKKTVYSEDGVAPMGIKFRFTVSVNDENGIPISGIIYEKNGVKGALSDGKLLINLGNGESVTLYDIPAGSTYEIAEEPVANYTPDPGNVYGGILKNTEITAEIINNYTFVGQKYGDITVTNAVAGTDEDMLREFGFTLTLADPSINGVYGDLEFIDGIAQFSLTNGGIVTAAGLPADVGYTVSENIEGSEEFITTDSGNAAGTVPADGAVTVMFYNERDVGAVGGLTVKSTVIGGSKPFSFAVQLYGEQPISGRYGDMEFDSAGLAVFTLAPGQSITATGLPAGTHYTVTLTDADEIYTTEYTDDCAGVIPKIANANVEFINTRRTGSLRVKNTVIGGADEFTYIVRILDKIEPGNYGDMYFNTDGIATFTLSNGGNVTASGLPAGVSYEVIEAEANQRGYITSSNGAIGIIPNNMTANASFINTLPAPGCLTVSKTVIGGNGGESFGFLLSLTDPAGMPLSGTFGSIETAPDGTARFTLSDGMSISIPLPEGTVYSVSEDVLSAPGYISETSGMTSGTISADGASVAFTNTLRTGSLTVSDYIGGNAADPEMTFGFTVTAPVVGRYGDMVFDVSGTATFTLGHGQTATAEGLPAGITYTVTETDANSYGYVTECNGVQYAAPVTGTITENAVSEVKFRNIRQVDGADAIGALTVINNIIGTVTDEEFMFTVTVDDSNGVAMTALSEDYTVGAAVYAQSGKTVIEFALKHGESKRIDGLPAGARYTVTESNSLYYLVSSVNSVGTVLGGKNSTAVFTNRWNVGDLSVSVVVEDDSEVIRTDDRAEFTYRVTLDGVGTVFGYPSHMTDNYAATEAGDKLLMQFDENGVAEFTLKSGKTAIAPDLPAGIGYKTELVSCSDDLHYDKSESGTVGVITAGKLSEAEYVYYIRTGSLTLTKELLDIDYRVISRNVEFEFTVRLYGADGLPLSGAYIYDGAHSGIISDQGVINLRGGESVTVRGLPEGSTYSVSEKSVYRYPMLSAKNSEGVISAGENVETIITNRQRVYPILPHSPDDDNPDTPDDREDPDIVELDRPTAGLYIERREDTEEVISEDTIG